MRRVKQWNILLKHPGWMLLGRGGYKSLFEPAPMYTPGASEELSQV
jgi:hypothetical protein